MINIGIVGAGGMGTVHHSNYLHLDGCAVTGVVDPSPAGRERAFASALFYGVLERELTLRRILRRYSKKPPEKTSPPMPQQRS